MCALSAVAELLVVMVVVWIGVQGWILVCSKFVRMKTVLSMYFVVMVFHTDGPAVSITNLK